MTKTKLQPPVTETESPDEQLTAYTDWIARAVMHPDTPEVISDGLQSIIVNIASNESGYDWSNDEEGLRFMLPRLLFYMNDEYAKGLLQSMGELIDSTVSREVRDQLGSPYNMKGGER